MGKGLQITRRTVLRGMGAAVALPWLEATAPAQQPAERPPLRMMFLYHPLGAETTAWKGVTGAGRDLRLTPTLRPLERFKEKLLVLAFPRQRKSLGNIKKAVEILAHQGDVDPIEQSRAIGIVVGSGRRDGIGHGGAG